MSPPETMNPQHRNFLLGSLLLLCLALYASCALNGFVYDDHSQIEFNPVIHSFSHLGEILGSSIAVQQGKQAWANSYRPLVNFSFLISFKLFGYSPYGYHLINIFLHLIVVSMVFVVSVKLFSSESLGLIAAAIFALHPIHTEPVAWIDGISDPLFSVFYLLAFWFYLRLAEEPPEFTIRLRTGMGVSFFLALLSKETAMSFPILVTVFEHIYRSDRSLTSWAKKCSRYGWIWATYAAYMVMRVHALGVLSPPPTRPEMTARQILFSALALLGEYAKALVWPAPLVAFVPFRASSSFHDPYVLTGICVLVSAVALFAWLWKHSRLYTFPLVWSFLTIAPALNARWMAANVYAERYLYMPSLAFCWLLGGLILWCWKKSARPTAALRWALAGALAILAVVASCQIVLRSRDWKNDQTLILATLRVRPDAPNARSDYATMLWYSGHHQEAVRQWLLAFHYKPDTVEVLANLGMAKLDERKYDEAIAYLQKAIQLKPNFATPHVHLGRVYLAQAKPADAENEFLRAVDIYPADAEARKALGQFYLDFDRLPEAEAQFLAAREVAADFSTWCALGEIYARENRPDKEEDAWRHAVSLEPFDPKAHVSLGRIYLSKGQYPEAQKEFEACLLMQPANQEALAGMGKLNTLGQLHTSSTGSAR